MEAERQASEVDAAMREAGNSSKDGSFEEDDFEFAVDGASSSTDGAELTPDPDQAAEDDISVEDDMYFHPYAAQYLEDDIPMEDDGDASSEGSEGGKPPAPRGILAKIVREVR